MMVPPGWSLLNSLYPPPRVLPGLLEAEILHH